MKRGIAQDTGIQNPLTNSHYGIAKMNQWKAFGRTVWEPHMDGETRIADCDTEHVARQIAALPAITAIAEELLTAYKVERDSIASWAQEPGTTIIDKEYNDCLAVMTDLINRAENTIAAEKEKHNAR